MLDSTRQLIEGLQEEEEENTTKQRFALSKAITLIESTLKEDREQANLLLQHFLLPEKPYFRVGIAGPPGAGKSTLIDALGIQLLKEDYCTKLGVVCVDPSSTISGGSILGDKTRMRLLSTTQDAYVRPCANGGEFGGLSPTTDDVVSVLAVKYDWIIVESVGLGQSEIEICQSVDMMILVLPPASGDELQGFKKGIVEVADMIVVSKADGDLLPYARLAAAEYRSATQYRCNNDNDNSNDDWNRAPVVLVSARTQTGLEDLQTKIIDYRTMVETNGQLQRKRRNQARYWTSKNLQTLIIRHTKYQRQNDDVERQLEQGQITPRLAADRILESVIWKTSTEK